MQISPALIRTSVLALSGVLLAPAAAFAADGESTPLNLGGGDDGGQAAEHVGASGASIVRTIVGLAVVIGVIYGLTWVLKQVKASKSATAAGTGLETLASLPLGANHSLHLVRAGDELVLVGTGEQGVTPIRTYTEAEARALGLVGPPVDGVELVAPEEVFGTETRRGRLIDELRKRTVIK
jgi:flagellar protein FliO/FliZ